MGQTTVQGFPQSFVFPSAIDYIESRDDSLAGRVQYHLVGRAWLLGEALFATITAIGSLCIAAIGGLYSLVDSEGQVCARRAIENARSDWNMIKKCLSVLVSQQLLPQEPDLRGQEKVSGEASPQTGPKSKSAPHSPHEAKEPEEEDSPFVDVAGDFRETRVVKGDGVI